MEDNFKETAMLRGRINSVQAFANRVIITLIILVFVSSAAVFLFTYLPLKSELQKSLVDNFNKIGYIRYVSLQNYINRGLEGARSLSSRTVIRNALIDYKDGKISLDELTTITQSKYEDGASALEYLLKAERFVDDQLIARYTVSDVECQLSSVWQRLGKNDEIAFAFCMPDGHEYLMIQSPVLSQRRVIGYDQLIFDLTDQMQTLRMENIKSELACHDEFEDLIQNAIILRNNDVSSLFYKDGIFYQAFHIQDGTHFITRQSGASLLEPVYRLSWQILLAGIGILITFTMAVYLFVIRHAKNELEDGWSLFRDAMSEANTDPLTGAGSRRLGEELLSALFERFQKGEPSPLVLLFDIDSFKKINDTYGHSVGDKVIRSVAAAIRMNIRSEDILLRWGGDEFIGIFRGLSNENSIPFAQKLLQIVANLVIETDTETIRPTISIGISYFREEDRSYTDVINRADQAMYQSKSEGKNKVHVI